jgi:hypothetical protein
MQKVVEQEQNYCKSNYKQVLKPSNNCKQTLFVEERSIAFCLKPKA